MAFCLLDDAAFHILLRRHDTPPLRRLIRFFMLLPLRCLIADIAACYFSRRFRYAAFDDAAAPFSLLRYVRLLRFSC